MRSHNHPIILFIDRFGFSIFQDTLPNIPRFNFTPDIVSNLDVVNKDQFTNLITTFIQINKIVPSSFAVILSDTVIYTKDLINKVTPATNPIVDMGSEHKDEIQNFLENIPFEEVLAKVIKTGELSRIVAANKDLIMTIANVFTNKGSVMDAIVPSFLYGPKVNFAGGLTQENIQVILGGSEIFRVGNLLTDQQKVASPQSTEAEIDKNNKKPQNLRQYILVGVLVTLLVILAVVYLNLGVSQTTPKKIKSSSVNTVTTPTVIPTSTQALITTAPVDIKNIKVKIVQSSQIDPAADALRNELAKLGFQDIVNEVLENSSSEKSSILFSQSVPIEMRESVVLEIKKILPDIAILENQDPGLTIAVLIGKS